MNKYNNKKTEIDNVTFDSQKESMWYMILKARQRAGKIKDLVLQPRFVLQLAFTDNQRNKHRMIEYVADFKYTENGITIVEDVKGMKTEVYRIKKKLFLYAYPDLVFREL